MAKVLDENWPSYKIWVGDLRVSIERQILSGIFMGEDIPWKLTMHYKIIVVESCLQIYKQGLIIVIFNTATQLYHDLRLMVPNKMRVKKGMY